MATLQPHKETWPRTFIQDRKLEKIEWKESLREVNGWEGGRESQRQSTASFSYSLGWGQGGGVGGAKLLFYILHKIYKPFPCLSPDGNCTMLWGFWPGMLGCVSERSMCPLADQSNICWAITDSSKRSETRDMQTQRTFQGVRIILLAPCC